MNRLFLLIALVLAASSCRKPMPSPDYIEASNRYTSLLALHGDDAFARPEMDEVNAQLGRVTQKSSDYARAIALIATIGTERARVAAAAAQAAVVPTQPAPVFPDFPKAPVEAPAAVVEAPRAPDAPVSELSRGADFAALNSRYPGCLLPLGPIALTRGDGGTAENDGYGLHDSAHCRTKLPGMASSVLLVTGGKIAAMMPAAGMKTFTTLEDGGVVPVP